MADPEQPSERRREARRRQVRRRRWTAAAVVLVVLIASAGGAAALSRTAGHHAPRTRALAASHAPSRRHASTTTDTQTQTPQSTRTARTTATTHTSQAAAAPPARRRGCSFHLAAARHVAETERSAGFRIGFAFVTAGGRSLAAVAPNTPNYSASVTKSMLLVAFLRDWAPGGLDAADRQELTAMIEVSDNEAADWVYAHLRSPSADVERVAADAGMTGFHLDTSDPVYVLGQSLVTARDLARFFSRIETYMPASARGFGMGLLAGVQERVGLLEAGLPGRVFSKEGWKPEPAGLLGAPYIVNQAAQFSCRGLRYGVAVTVGHAEDQQQAEGVVQQIVAALRR